MIVLTGFVVVLLLQAAAVRGPWLRRSVVAGVAALALGGTAVAATLGDGAPPLVPLTALAVLTAAAGGPLVAVGLRIVPAPPPPPSGQPEPLRGGMTIGVLERIAVCVTLLLGWPEGLAVALAVKSLARYPELRAAIGSAERFIVGTFASVLWAAACAGTALLSVG